VLASALELIAHKHVSLRVLPEHYPIVGKHLLASIEEVLGDAATKEIIDAWAAAYGVLAGVLIAREAELYQAQEREHGWQGFRRFKVQRKQAESQVITSFYLAPADGMTVRPFKAGQYVTVRMPAADGSTTMRNYSLSGAPGEACYRISVKREPSPGAEAPDGYVSNYLHGQVEEGETIEVAPPCGEFTLDEQDHGSRPLVLISGGVGITPVLSMLHAALKRNDGREIWFIHAAINGDTHAFRREVLDLADQHPSLHVHFRYSQPTRCDRERELFDSEGLINGAFLSSLLESSEAAFYLCGPKEFMAQVREGLLAWSAREADIRYEFFGPLQALRSGAVAVGA
jgi:nitric oxide dioxygenase